MTRKNSTAPRAAYTSRVIALAAEKVRDAKRLEREHRVAGPALDEHEADRRHEPHDERRHGEVAVPLDERSRSGPPSDSAASPAPSTSYRPVVGGPALGDEDAG